MQLQHTGPSGLRRMFGRFALAALATGCIGTGLLARAGTVPAGAPMYDLAMTVTTSAGVSSPRIRTEAGATSSVRVGDAASGWAFEFVISDAGNDKVLLKSKVTSGGATVSEPALQVRLGESGRVRISGPGKSGTFDLQFVVTKADGAFIAAK